MMKVPVWGLVCMFGCVISLQSWTLSEIVNLKVKVASLEVKAEFWRKP